MSLSPEVVEALRGLLGSVNPKTRDEAALLVQCYDEIAENTTSAPDDPNAISNT